MTSDSSSISPGFSVKILTLSQRKIMNSVHQMSTEHSVQTLSAAFKAESCLQGGKDLDDVPLGGQPSQGRLSSKQEMEQKESRGELSLEKCQSVQ